MAEDRRLVDLPIGTDNMNRLSFRALIDEINVKAAGGLQGTLAARPAASAMLERFIYKATDQGATGKYYWCDGVGWAEIGAAAPLADSAPPAIADAGAVGLSTDAAREDHTHAPHPGMMRLSVLQEGYSYLQQPSGSGIYHAKVIGDAHERWIAYTDGRQEWGPGNALRDTELRRTAAGELVAANYLIPERSIVSRLKPGRAFATEWVYSNPAAAALTTLIPAGAAGKSRHVVSLVVSNPADVAYDMALYIGGTYGIAAYILDLYPVPPNSVVTFTDIVLPPGADLRVYSYNSALVFSASFVEATELDELAWASVARPGGGAWNAMTGAPGAGAMRMLTNLWAHNASASSSCEVGMRFAGGPWPFVNAGTGLAIKEMLSVEGPIMQQSGSGALEVFTNLTNSARFFACGYVVPI